MATRRRGRQEPTFSTVGAWGYTDGEYAASMFRRYGVRFYESQELELSVFLARGGDGAFAAKTICISKPRQNGKSFAARFYAVWMAAIEGKHVLFSAHHGKTVRKMFKEIRGFVEGNADFTAMLKPGGQGVYKAAGSEGLYFVDEDGDDAGLIEFQTRTNSAARGETYQVIIVDEAQELTDEQLEAMKPTTFAASDVDEADSDPQMIYLGTPPNAKCPGTVFRDYHDRAHSEPDTPIWWMEWAVEEIPDMSDKAAVLELAYETNPAMGYRIKESTMLDAMGTMRADGFARECLGWWSAAPVAVHPIAAADWQECLTACPPGHGDATYAVKFSPDGLTGALAVCLAPPEGPPLVEVVESRALTHGVGWFAEFVADVADVASSVVVDGRSNAQNLVDRLSDMGVDVEGLLHHPTTAEVVAACSSFVEATRDHSIAHIGQPALDDAATMCRKRRIGSGGGYGFESTEKADATLLEACALAYWRAMSTRRDTASELRIA